MLSHLLIPNQDTALSKQF